MSILAKLNELKTGESIKSNSFADEISVLIIWNLTRFEWTYFSIWERWATILAAVCRLWRATVINCSSAPFSTRAFVFSTPGGSLESYNNWNDCNRITISNNVIINRIMRFYTFSLTKKGIWLSCWWSKCCHSPLRRTWSTDPRPILSGSSSRKHLLLVHHHQRPNITVNCKTRLITITDTKAHSLVDEVDWRNQLITSGKILN